MRTAMRAAAGLLAALLVAAGCGGEEESGNAAADRPVSTTPTGNTKAGSGVTDYLKYTGGKAGAADRRLAPIVIGWVNQQGGAVDIGPGSTKGAQLAVRYINDKLGGIGGHPLKLRTCFTSTAEEQGQACAQKLLNDHDVHVIAVGAVAVGGQSFVSTVDGQKPIVNALGVEPWEVTNRNGYMLFGDSTHVSLPFGTFARDVLKAHSAALLHAQVAGSEVVARGVRDGLEAAGISVKRVNFQPTDTDLVGPLTAAGAQSADVIAGNLDAKSCVNVAKTLDQLHLTTNVLVQPICLAPDVAKALGDLPRWYYAIASSLPSDTSDPASVAFMKVATAYGMAKEGAGDVFIPVSFSQILTIAQWMNAIGPDGIDEKTIAAKAKAFKGPLALGAPTLHCGKYPDAPAVCNDQVKFYRYDGGGKFTPASGWLRPPS